MVNQIKNLPWIAIRDVGFLARKHLATKERPRRNHITVPLSADEVKDRLMNRHFREGWFMSYHYHGEKYNLCRAEGEDPEGNNKQLHIRVFEYGEMASLIFAHTELCPIEHPRRHINGELQSVEEGLKMTEEILLAENVSSKQIDKVEVGG